MIDLMEPLEEHPVWALVVFVLGPLVVVQPAVMQVFYLTLFVLWWRRSV